MIDGWLYGIPRGSYNRPAEQVKAIQALAALPKVTMERHVEVDGRSIIFVKKRMKANLSCLDPKTGHCSISQDEGRVVPKLEVAFLPARVPLVDWSRQLENEADIFGDLINKSFLYQQHH